MKLFLLKSSLVLLFSCSKTDDNCIPNCLSEEIEKLLSYNCIGKPNISEYYFQYQFVYLLDAGICSSDDGYTIINSNCKEIGYIGGVLGLTIVNGEDFTKKAKLIRVIWEK